MLPGNSPRGASRCRAPNTPSGIWRSAVPLPSAIGQSGRGPRRRQFLSVSRSPGVRFANPTLSVGLRPGRCRGASGFAGVRLPTARPSPAAPIRGTARNHSTASRALPRFTRRTQSLVGPPHRTGSQAMPQVFRVNPAWIDYRQETGTPQPASPAAQPALLSLAAPSPRPGSSPCKRPPSPRPVKWQPQNVTLCQIASDTVIRKEPVFCS